MQQKENQYILLIYWFSFCGGGEENRTPVRKFFHMGFSECIRLFYLPCTASAGELYAEIAPKS